MTKEEIGQILKELRLSCGKTQKEVAELLGRKQQIVGHWETGYAQPDANTLFTLCDIYGTTVDAAFGFKKADLTISKKDIELLQKYQDLDDYGRETIDIALVRETERVTALRDKDSQIAKLESAPQPSPTRLINYYYRLASAGTGQIVFDMPPTRSIEIPDIPEYKKADYAIGVNGSSMEPVYHDGDILLVEMTDHVDMGEVGIFLVDGQSYVKQLGCNDLISLNKAYHSIPLTPESRCMGRVIAKLKS